MINYGEDQNRIKEMSIKCFFQDAKPVAGRPEIFKPLKDKQWVTLLFIPITIPNVF